jgi:hypothetical protein
MSSGHVGLLALFLMLALMLWLAIPKCSCSWNAMWELGNSNVLLLPSFLLVPLLTNFCKECTQYIVST